MDNKQYNEQKIIDIVTKGWGKVKLGEIAKEINRAGLRTKTGRTWSHATVSTLAIRTLGLPRLKNTILGPAGSTFDPGARGSKPAKTRAPRKAKAMETIEDIMTSNLGTDTKLKLIGLLTNG